MCITGCIEAEKVLRPGGSVLPRGPHESAFGDFARGRFAWQRTRETIRLDEPIPCEGHQGLWDLPREVETRMLDQLRLGAWPASL